MSISRLIQSREAEAKERLCVMRIEKRMMGQGWGGPWWSQWETFQGKVGAKARLHRFKSGWDMKGRCGKLTSIVRSFTVGYGKI